MSSSRVDQLVQKRTAVWSGSGFDQKQALYWDSSAASARSGRTGNCWLVGEGKRRGQPLSRKALCRRSAWATARAPISRYSPSSSRASNSYLDS